MLRCYKKPYLRQRIFAKGIVVILSWLEPRPAKIASVSLVAVEFGFSGSSLGQVSILVNLHVGEAF